MKQRNRWVSEGHAWLLVDEDGEANGDARGTYVYINKTLAMLYRPSCAWTPVKVRVIYERVGKKR